MAAELEDPACPALVPVVVEHPAMRRVYHLIDQIAGGTIGVLLLGETGVGKEVLAEALHRRSPRAGRPFLRLNCAALSETLLESELFGHEKGAFTGALQAKPGLFETATGGTVFLDEIGELPVSLQAKLLRVIEERKVWRIGGLKPRPLDVRFVTATNRDLEREIERGRFRADLYFRLNCVTITVPPLRARRSEIPPLAGTFVAAASRELRRSAPRISDEAMRLLRIYSWPGNIRELKNMMERAVLLCRGDLLLPEHLPLEQMSDAANRSDPDATGRPEPHPASADGGLDDEIGALERRRILAALADCAGNQTQAAKKLGISRSKLLARLDVYGVPRPRRAS